MNRYTFSKEARAALEGLQQPLAVYQLIENRITTLLVSDGFCTLLGYTDREQAVWDMDHEMYKDTHPDDVKRISNVALHFAEGNDDYDVIFRTKAGIESDYRVIHAHGRHVYTETGIRLAHVWYMDEGVYIEGDESAGTRMNRELNSILHEESILKATNYDALTGLPNLAYFFKLCEEKKNRLFSEGRQGCLLYLDLNGMKYYNHRYGFAEGDKLLKAMAERLSNTFGPENCCHVGADRFAAAAREEGLEDRLNRFFNEVRQLNNHLPVRVGIYTTRLEDTPVSSAYDRAKMACDSVPKAESSGYNYYTRAMSEADRKRRYIESSIDEAIAEKWIRVYYQPIVRAVNGKVCDEEALARWIDPKLGFLSPAEFIPYLEDSGLIYKLDLYVLEQTLEKIRKQADNGLYVVPHSINLSRSDFGSCDIVEEVRKRVDASGIARDKITIEITESVIGRDFDYMKAQVERFRELGFAVWMDDFGSGYSSLDVLQSIRFDLIKFDMSFMRKLDESGKIILTELMKMATSLGVDTVCEGVETENQLHFLQEIGCSKLQGFYFCKPVPYEEIVERNRKGIQIGYENPDESSYYESMGRINLYDLAVIANEEVNSFHNSFNTIPMCIIEVKDDMSRFVRSNQSYRNFLKGYYGIDLVHEGSSFHRSASAFMQNLTKTCCERNLRSIYDEKMPDGSVVHSFARRIGTNPVTGCIAVAVAVLSVSEPNEGETYADIARALAADYYNIYLIDLDTNEFVEYKSLAGEEDMTLERRGLDFFESARRDTMIRIYEEDREPFLAMFTKERVIQDLNSQGVFTTTYRLIDTGTPMYVNMKITRMQGGNRIILGVSNIDAHMRQIEGEKRLLKEKISLGRIAALSPDYIVLYAVDPETNHYTQYNPSNDFASLGLDKQGDDFFADIILDAPKVIAPEDMERHLRVLTKKNMLWEIQENGLFVYNYRLRLNGKYVLACLRAALVEEEDGKKIIIGVTNDEQERNRHNLEEAYEKARDTGIVYTHLAHALARGYTDLYYVNMETDELIEFHTDDERGVLNEARRSADFFEGCERDAKLFVHPEDQEKFVKAMNRAFLEKALDQSKVFELTYRRIKDGRPFYVLMKVSRMEDDPRIIVIAVSDIDELMRQRRAEERIREERIIYARLHALTGNFIAVYVVDPETNRYREFSATHDYAECFAQAKEGVDFFKKAREVARDFNHPDDLARFLSAFTKENILAEVGHSGIFTLGYRVMMEGKPLHIQMKAAMVEEKEGPRLIVGLNDIDAQVRHDEEYQRRLLQAQSQASIDALTGVKNKHAFILAETQMDKRIAEHHQGPFAIVVLDVNDLKVVNDTSGHNAGDQYLRDACKIICDIFKHSPVFRVGGDEFAVICQGRDYEAIEARIKKMNENNEKALQSGGIVIACGMSKAEDDACIAAVFERADHKMYENKRMLKEMRG